MTSEQKYQQIVSAMEASGEAKASKMFGMPCLKNANGKAFAGYFKGDMTFKLPREILKPWLSEPGAKLFDPSDMNRPMKEWLHLPPDYIDAWEQLSKDALLFVNSLIK